MKRCTCTSTFNPDCPVDHDLIAESLENEVNDRIKDMSFSEKREWRSDYNVAVFFGRTKRPFRDWLKDRIETSLENCN